MDNGELMELPQDNKAERKKRTPEQEFKRSKRKRYGRRVWFSFFVLLQSMICLVYYAFVYSDDLHYRVTKQLENQFSNQISLSTGTFVGETDFGYFTDEGRFEFNTGSVYEGLWDENQMNGLGKLTVPSEGIYEGEFLDSEKSGHGVFTWDDGTVYDGQWRNDQMEGQGTYTGFDQVQYVGTFSGNSFHAGKCTFTNETGSYIVEYKDFVIDCINVTFTDGTTYVGDCDGETLTGNGIMAFVNGDQYTGSFSNGVRSGEGVYSWINGDSYNGTWDSDSMSGTGTYTFASGSIAQGTFNANLFTDGSYTVSNDFGDYTFTIKDSEAVAVDMVLKSGTTYSGEMEDGSLTGTAQISYSNGDKYSGRVIDGYKNGQGSYIWSSGASYEGDWSEDKMQGQGTYFYPSNGTGYKLTGSFTNGVPNGSCQYYVSSSESYKTDWKDGRCVKIYE